MGTTRRARTTLRFTRAGLDELRTSEKLRGLVKYLVGDPFRAPAERLWDALLYVCLVSCANKEGQLVITRERLKQFMDEHFMVLMEMVEEVVGEETLQRLAQETIDASMVSNGTLERGE